MEYVLYILAVALAIALLHLRYARGRERRRHDRLEANALRRAAERWRQDG